MSNKAERGSHVSADPVLLTTRLDRTVLDMSGCFPGSMDVSMTAARQRVIDEMVKTIQDSTDDVLRPAAAANMLHAAMK